MRHITVVLFGCLLICCQQQEIDENPLYFDFNSFIEKEIVLLEKQERKVKKIIQFNGQRETRDLTPKSGWWADELSLFLKTDINRPAWRNRFGVDTAITRPGFFTIAYSGDELLPLKRAEILFENNTPIGCILKREVKNAYGQTVVEMHYTRNKSYSVVVKQIVNYISETSYEIQGQVIN